MLPIGKTLMDNKFNETILWGFCNIFNFNSYNLNIDNTFLMFNTNYLKSTEGIVATFIVVDQNPNSVGFTWDLYNDLGMELKQLNYNKFGRYCWVDDDPFSQMVCDNLKEEYVKFKLLCL